MRTTWHAHTTSEGKLIWVKGRITNLVITADGYLRGDHEVQLESSPTIYTISGHVSRVDHQLHVVWRGWHRLKRAQLRHHGFNVPPDESYAVSLAGELPVSRKLIGHWLGRHSGEQFRPDFGYFILSENDQACPTQQELVAYEADYAKLEAKHPPDPPAPPQRHRNRKKKRNSTPK